MVTKMTASGEWLIPSASNIPSAGPSGSINESGLFCFECSRSYRACECKSCLKCGSPFQKYFGTNLIKGRSHCRVCSSPVCSTCIILIKGLQKVCTRCHLKQKEEELITEKALSAICEAKFGAEQISSLTNLKTAAQKTEALLEAAKKGHDHLVVTMLNLGCDVNSTDLDGNTPLFYAAEIGSLPCVALLVEKGANIFSKNNGGWTPLHAAAWKGSTENHLECAELLLEMGAEVLEESDMGETAGDLASRCGGRKEMIQILRAAEVEIAMEVLENKASTLLASTNVKDKKFGKLISSVLKYFNEVNRTPPTPKLQERKINQLLLPVQTLPKTASLDRTTIDKGGLCSKCKGPKTSVDLTPAIHINNSSRPKDDIEPIIRPSSSSFSNNKIQNSFFLEKKRKELEDLNSKLQDEKTEWEERCRKLMASIAVSSKDHQKQVDDLEKENERLKEEKVNIASKCDATFTNKLAKIKMEFDANIAELEETKSLIDEERLDLLHLQKQYKMTWIPDDMVKLCQNTKCRQAFTKTSRKHHCRCCGRVYCSPCSTNKINLEAFGYTKAVRVCNTCYALVDDIAVQP